MPSSVPVDRVQIFDRTGLPLAEFQTSVERAWLIGDEGRAQFTYPTRKSTVVNNKVLRFGNWVLVENDLLPEWVGVIDTPRDWGAREVTVSAYTPEHVFGQRIGPLESVHNASAGHIFSVLLGWVNKAQATVIQSDSIWFGGKKQEVTINPDPLSDVLKQLVEDSGEEYAWKPVTDVAGRLRVRVSWKKQIGVSSPMILQEGTGGGNIEGVRGSVLIEDGPLVNSMLGYNDGATWKDRMTVTVRDDDSVKRYGLRQGSQEFQGVTSSTVLRNKAGQAVRVSSEPNRTLVLNALNVGQTFQHIGLGNRHTIRFEHIGFESGSLGYETTVRVIGMYYDPTERNKIELTAEAV